MSSRSLGVRGGEPPVGGRSRDEKTPPGASCGGEVSGPPEREKRGQRTEHRDEIDDIMMT
jgi:hypothetical protein